MLKMDPPLSIHGLNASNSKVTMISGLNHAKSTGLKTSHSLSTVRKMSTESAADTSELVPTLNTLQHLSQAISFLITTSRSPTSSCLTISAASSYYVMFQNHALSSKRSAPQ